TAKLIHMVFKVAEEMAPSVIYIDDIDKIFTFKKKSSELSKMKSLLLSHKEYLMNNPHIRVLVIGNSRNPYSDLVDRKDLLRMFSYKSFGKMMFLPCPNYSTR